MARRRGSTSIKSVRAVERALDILQCFSADKPEMGVLDIQDRVPLNRATLYRLLHTLSAKGLVRAYGDPQRFSLDHGVGRLASNWMAGIDPIRAGHLLVQQLREQTNETAALFILRGDQRLCVLEVAAPHFLKISRGVGETEHISSGASGKAMLAFMPPDEAEPILRTLPRTADRKQLLQALDRIRGEGFAISRAEVFAGAIAIAAPYFDHTGRVAGSIGVFGPQARLDQSWERKAVRLVLEAARQLSTALGHPGAAPRAMPGGGAPRPGRKAARPG
jgi:IclR family transcriptional regulator, acetate operon repressor